MAIATNDQIANAFSQLITDKEIAGVTRDQILAWLESLITTKNIGEQLSDIIIKNSLSAYGDILASPLYPAVQVDFVYSIHPDLTNTTVTGSGTVFHENNMACMQTGTTTGSTAIIMSTDTLKNRTGQGQLMRFSCLFDTGVADTRQEAGASDMTDGYMFIMDGVDLAVLHLNNSVETIVKRSAWNKDRFNGAGGNENPSGVKIDETKGNQYQVNYNWPFGTILFAIQDPNDGIFKTCHILKAGNKLLAPSLVNPTLFMHMRVKNLTTTANIKLCVGDFALLTEGFNIVEGPKFSTSASNSSVGTTEVPILSLRNRTTYQSITNRIKIFPKGIFYANEGNTSLLVRIRVNATLTGPVFADVDTVASVAEVDTTATVVSGGRIVDTIILAKSISGGFQPQLPDFQKQTKILPGDTTTITAQSFTGGSSNFGVSFNWLEDH